MNSHWREQSIFKAFVNKFSMQVQLTSIRKIENPLHYSHLIHFLIHKFRSNYEFGGFRGYKFHFLGLLSPTHKHGNSKLKRGGLTDLSGQASMPEFLLDLRDSLNEVAPNQLNILSLFPSSFARTADESKYPQLLNIMKSSEIAKVNFYDFSSDRISDANNFKNVSSLSEEWNQVKATVKFLKIDVVIILGHKRSFCQENAIQIKKIKDALDTKFVLYITDNWNTEYIAMIEQWIPYMDLVLSYDYKIFDRLPQKSHGKVLVWPVYPIKAIEKFPLLWGGKVKVYFCGSIYLNRWAWIWLASLIRFVRKYDFTCQFDMRFQPISGREGDGLSIVEYQKKFRQNGLASIHFLERHPGTYALTSSVWDAIANGGLVIVQTSAEHDPLEKFFIPGKHYLRFTDVSQLAQILNLLSNDQNKCTVIADECFAFFSEMYKPRHQWARLQDTLFGGSEQNYE